MRPWSFVPCLVLSLLCFFGFADRRRAPRRLPPSMPSPKLTKTTASPHPTPQHYGHQWYIRPGHPTQAQAPLARLRLLQKHHNQLCAAKRGYVSQVGLLVEQRHHQQPFRQQEADPQRCHRQWGVWRRGRDGGRRLGRRRGRRRPGPSCRPGELLGLNSWRARRGRTDLDKSRRQAPRTLRDGTAGGETRVEHVQGVGRALAGRGHQSSRHGKTRSSGTEVGREGGRARMPSRRHLHTHLLVTANKLTLSVLPSLPSPLP